jgi:hypothetical protein
MYASSLTLVWLYGLGRCAAEDLLSVCYLDTMSMSAIGILVSTLVADSCPLSSFFSTLPLRSLGNKYPSADE